MIIQFSGLPGEGKTAGMAYQACKALKQGRRVLSNVPITDTIFGTKNTAEYTPDIGKAVESASNALICIDEASIVLPNYFWEKLPFDLLIRFAQVRKYGLDIYYTSQSWNHTVKRLRDLTNYAVKCTNHKFWFSYQYLDPEYFMNRIPSHYMKDYVKKTELIMYPKFPKLFRSYNTMHIVEKSIMAQSGAGLTLPEPKI